MGRLKISALVGAALFLLPAAGALAADIPEIPAPAHFAGGWYLKGYIGMANQGFHGLSNPSFDLPVTFGFLDPGSFAAVPLFGVGVGYQASDHFRLDVTGEYRGKSDFSALDQYDTDGDPATTGDTGTNHYTGKKSEFLFLANAYYDFNSWNRMTPYVGAGIGASYNTISDFEDDNIITGGQGWAPTGHELSLAWALHAGAAFKVSDNLTLDVGYSFVSLGNAKTGPFQNVDPTAPGSCNLTDSCVPMNFKSLYSNDFKIGLRWALGTPTQSYYPPVVKY